MTSWRCNTSSNSHTQSAPSLRCDSAALHLCFLLSGRAVVLSILLKPSTLDRRHQHQLTALCSGRPVTVNRKSLSPHIFQYHKVRTVYLCSVLHNRSIKQMKLQTAKALNPSTHTFWNLQRNKRKLEKTSSFIMALLFSWIRPVVFNLGCTQPLWVQDMAHFSKF